MAHPVIKRSAHPVIKSTAQPLISSTVLSLLETTFFSATEKLAAGNKTLSTVHIQIDPVHGDLRFFGEGDYASPKGKVTIYNCILKKNEEQADYRHRISVLLKNAFSSMRGKHTFNRPCISCPFSIHLIDADGNLLEQVFTFTSPRTIPSPASPPASPPAPRAIPSPSPSPRVASANDQPQPFLPNLQRDLDIFLKQLLPESK
ncbi:MAG: hypothetical protein LBT73_00530 [Tannerellaceae bacterium]|nr:hypothetical protein [Tannerellaceae bacterium]